MAVQEVSPTVDIRITRNRVYVFLNSEPSVPIEFIDIPAVSRALSIVKESPEYQAWLIAQGLA